MNISLVKSRVAVAPFRDQNAFSGKIITLAMVSSVVVLINILVKPSRFADYDSYLQFTDFLYYFSNFSWLYFEPISSSMLFYLRVITDNTEKAVDISHYVLSAMFISLNYLILTKRQVYWQGYVVFVAFYGALLAFVTFRATPAYLLVTIALLYALEGRKLSFFYIIFAILFHISSLLAVPIFISIFFQSKFDFMKNFNMKYLVLIIGLISTSSLFISNSFSLIVVDLLEQIPFFSKYLAYTSNVNLITGATIGNKEDGFFHTIYAIVISIFSSAMLLSKNKNCVRFRTAVLIGYLTFAFMQFSPVTAYRQSIFWMAPSLLIYNWQKLYIGRYGALPFLALSIALAAYQFQNIYS